ncbi:HAD-IA family hydrolase [Paenibacillus aurantius]|uniref:HAD-IA family hydrolase n=1 Tax=Paenibacillus aurantius TaxID=2918900 RepID=A0AA96LG01_9BACL|nr:HAD-IA family hydrolase [Paenibacillus aurantius]WNQ12615.1 HAD-IA family hydrolase [Paenibacillus aurantius]
MGSAPKPLTAYKAVFFDVGDTLMTIPAARLIMRQFLAQRSFHREEDEIGGLFHEAFQLFYYGKQLNPDEVCSPESDRQFWIQLYRFILDRLGAEEEWTEDEIHACCHEMYDVFTAPEQYQLFEDVEESLEAFSKRGLRLGVISNFAPTLRHILEAKGILSYFDPVIVSTEVGIEKPNPSIFRLALEEAGLEAKDVLYIGDHEHNDLWAPAQVGIDAVKIKRYDYMEGEGIRSLLELL